MPYIGVTEEQERLVMKKLYDGDSRCSISIGSEVVKSFAEAGDEHKVGTKGRVIGNMYIEHLPKNNEAYLVQFEGTERPVFIIGNKIKLYDTELNK